MELNKFIKYYDLINPKLVSKLIKFINTVEYKEALTLGGLTKNIRNVEEYTLNPNDKKSLTNVKWFNTLKFYIKQAVDLYKEDSYKLINEKPDPRSIEVINILKYKENYFYKKHVDHHHDVPRTLSVIIFLNNDYKGGDLFFYFGEEKLKIKPNVGRILIWPSNFQYPHQVEPVSEGTRYVVVSWLL